MRPYFKNINKTQSGMVTPAAEALSGVRKASAGCTRRCCKPTDQPTESTKEGRRVQEPRVLRRPPSRGAAAFGRGREVATAIFSVFSHFPKVYLCVTLAKEREEGRGEEQTPQSLQSSWTDTSAPPRSPPHPCSTGRGLVQASAPISQMLQVTGKPCRPWIRSRLH